MSMSAGVGIGRDGWDGWDENGGEERRGGKLITARGVRED
jgi:hypothetical protein